jgi:homoserine dehydrogenase
MLQEGRTRPPIRIVGVSDSSGGVVCKGGRGLPLSDLLRWKMEGKSMCSFVRDGVDHYDSTIEMLSAAAVRGNILFDGTPVDLQTGGMGLECCRFGAANGIHLVLANKAPLVLAYQELIATCKEEPACCIEFSATVCGGLPVVNVGRRDLSCARIDMVQGIFNSTTNYILSRMASGEDASVALRTAQEVGIAEADPSLDLQGFDTANKLVIICNSVLNFPAKLSDVDLTGITDVTSTDIQDAAVNGEVIRLIATATRRVDTPSTGAEVSSSSTSTSTSTSGLYALSVKPTRVKDNSFFGGCSDSDMCVVFRSDEFETISMKTDEKGVFPTSCAMLRDCFGIIRSIQNNNN